MGEELRIDLPESRRGKGAVVDRLVSFLKASYIYPANNRRVVDAADDLIDEVDRTAKSDRGVVVQVLGEGIRVDGEEVELSTGLTGWLKDAFVNARLAGIQLKRGVSRETLHGFADRLRRASRNEFVDFTSDWPSEFSDLKPLDLMFRGLHSPGAGDHQAADDPADVLLDDDPLLTEPLAPDSEQRALVVRLSEDEGIGERLTGIEERWSQVLDREFDVAGMDLLTEIARLLPAEAIRDEERARNFIHRVLDTFEDYVPGEDDAGNLVNTHLNELHGLALNVARRYFDVKAPKLEEGETPEAELPTGRPEDEAYVDDVDALLAEFEELPDAVGLSFPTDDKALGGELLGIYLHRLVSGCEGEERRHLSQLLSEQLDQVTPDHHDVLRTYLAPCLRGDVEAARESPEWSILEMLREQGRLDILQEAGLLNAEMAAALFPEQFGLFLDSLTPDDGEDREMLRRTIEMIGAARIREAMPALAEEKKLLTPRRIAVLLSVESPEVVPLLGLVVAHVDLDTRRDIALLLRKLEPPPAESAALRAVNPPDLLPAGYLRDLCQFAWDGDGSAKLRRYSSFLLTKYIHDIGGDISLVEQRIYAIRTLRDLPGPETEELLKDLSTRGRLLGISKSARAIRQAAARTLEEIENV